jgi:hypothetical protein
VGLVTDYKDSILPNQIIYAILTIGLASRVLNDGTILNAIFSASFGLILVTAFYRIFYSDGKNSLLIVKDQALNYCKFILIASICLKLSSFIIYFFSSILIIAVFMLFGNFSAKRSPRLGAAIIIPFLWIILTTNIK